MRAAERTGPARERRRYGGWEAPLTILLLPFGAFLCGGGWFAGLLLLWTSRRWRVREKVMGTLVIPGGLGAPVLLTFAPERCVTTIEAGAVVDEWCGDFTRVSWADQTLLAALWSRRWRRPRCS